jgi:hypothetical protein
MWYVRDNGTSTSQNFVRTPAQKIYLRLCTVPRQDVFTDVLAPEDTRVVGLPHTVSASFAEGPKLLHRTSTFLTRCGEHGHINSCHYKPPFHLCIALRSLGDWLTYATELSNTSSSNTAEFVGTVCALPGRLDLTLCWLYRTSPGGSHPRNTTCHR